MANEVDMSPDDVILDDNLPRPPLLPEDSLWFAPTRSDAVLLLLMTLCGIVGSFGVAATLQYATPPDYAQGTVVGTSVAPWAVLLLVVAALLFVLLHVLVWLGGFATRDQVDGTAVWTFGSGALVTFLYFSPVNFGRALRKLGASRSLGYVLWLMLVATLSTSAVIVQHKHDNAYRRPAARYACSPNEFDAQCSNGVSR